MTTYPQTSFLSDVLDGDRIPLAKLAYFRARLSNQIHELVLSEFLRLERERKISKAVLARKIGRKPEQVTRWLGAAGNWELETLSDLLLGMGLEASVSAVSLANRTHAASTPPQLASVETALTAKTLDSLPSVTDVPSLPNAPKQNLLPRGHQAALAQPRMTLV